MSFKEYDNLLIVQIESCQRSRSASMNHKAIEVQKNKAVKVKNLVANQRREGKVVFSVINSDAGLLTSLEAIEKNKGGKVIAKLC